MEDKGSWKKNPVSEPRIKLEGLPKETRVSQIYDLCKNFGLVTFIGTLKNYAFVEFEDSISVTKAVSSQPLYVGQKQVSVVSQPEWLSGIKTEELFGLNEDIAALLCSEESLEAEAGRLVRVAEELRVPLTDRDSPPGPVHPVCVDLERLLDGEFPGVRVYPFGSRVSGLALESSDLDLFVDSGDMYEGKYDQEPDDQAYLVDTVRKRLAKWQNKFCHVCGLPRARVPLVRFLHVPSGVHCDTVFLHGLGCRKSRFVKFMLSLDERVQPLVLLLKRWVYTIDLTPQQGPVMRPQLTSHALTMLVFCFLQACKPPILPPARMIKEKAGYSCVIKGWETAFSEDAKLFRVKDPSDRRSLRDLFLGFLSFLQHTNWQEKAASVTAGGLVSRQSLPRVLNNPGAALVVLDPFDSGRNLTSHLCERTFCRLRAVCALTERAMGAA